MAVAGGTLPGTAVVQQGANGPADITQAGGLSAYGTMAQGGNVSEREESALDLINDEPFELRGGAVGIGATFRQACRQRFAQAYPLTARGQEEDFASRAQCLSRVRRQFSQQPYSLFHSLGVRYASQTHSVKAETHEINDHRGSVFIGGLLLLLDRESRRVWQRCELV